METSWGLRSLPLSLLLMLGLKLSLLAFFGVMPASDTGEPLLDLGLLLIDLQLHPERFWWLYATLFSTLIPTLIHLQIAAVGGVAALAPSLGDRLAGWVSQGGTASALAAWPVLSLLTTLVVMTPLLVVAAVWHTLHLLAPQIGYDGVLRVAVWTARALGVETQSGF